MYEIDFFVGKQADFGLSDPFCQLNFESMDFSSVEKIPNIIDGRFVNYKFTNSDFQNPSCELFEHFKFKFFFDQMVSVFFFYRLGRLI